MNKKKQVKVLVISDVHLGTYGCHAKELLNYLKSVNPEILILNGDIIDVWNFSKSYFPTTHMDVVRYILKLASHGTRVVYISGNHDEILRKYSDLYLGNFEIVDKLVLDLNGKKTWFFHGDVFDSTTKGYAKILAKLGGKGYDLLILINTIINWFSYLLGKEKLSISKKVKNSVKKAIKFISDFEQTAAEIAIENKYDYVVCGHIHQHQIKTITNEKGSVVYMNSGDWVENLTALEYDQNVWSIFQYDKEMFEPIRKKSKEKKRQTFFQPVLTN